MKGMKKLRRLFALLMAMIMVMGTCITTQAADTGSITITNAAVGETYSIYKLFDLSYNATTDSYYYTVASEWESFFATGGAGASYVIKNENNEGITWNGSEKVEELASAALAYAQDTSNGISAVASKTATGETLTFSDLKYGYYLVDSSLGALCFLTSTDPDAEIAEKNGTPTIEKTVLENTTGVYGVKNTSSTNGTIEFKIEISNASNVSGLVLHDEMSEGITLYQNMAVYKGESGSTTREVVSSSGNYKVTTSGLSDECDFEIEFFESFTDSLTDTEIIYVEYDAILNDNAVVEGEGNSNKAYVTYGDKQKSETAETTTYIYDLYIYKYDEEKGQEEGALEGAKFYLYKADGNMKYYAELDNNGKVLWFTGTKAYATEFESDSEGLIKVEGLGAGTYYLEEIEAPEGYSLLSEPIEFSITTEGILTKNNVAVSDTVEINGVEHSAIMVSNGHGAAMPTTGGIGTTIFYVVGSIMALGAAVVLITRRRMHES